MPNIASGGNVTIALTERSIVSVVVDGGSVRYENPVGTLVAEFSSDRTFGPIEAGISVKLTSVSGSFSYETGSATLAIVSSAAPVYWGPPLPNTNPQTTLVVKSATLPDPTNTDLSTVEWMHNGGGGYIFHLVGGSSMTTGALIGLGVEYGGRGLFVNNYRTGIGIEITQRTTITDSGAYGLLVNCGQGAAPGAWFQQNNTDGSLNAQSALVLFAYQSFSTSQKLFEWRKPSGTSSGTLAGYIRSGTGELVVQAPLTMSGAYDFSTDGQVQAVSAQIQGAGSFLDLYNTSGTADKRRFRWTVSSRFLSIGGRDDAGASTGDLLVFENTAQNVGIAGFTSFGTSSAKVLGIPDGTAPTTNPTAGVVVHSVSGAAKVRTPGGNIVTFAPNTALSVTGSRGANAALASLITQLATLGFISDGTSA